MTDMTMETATHSPQAAPPLQTVSWLRIEGAAAFALATVIYYQTGASWWLFAGLLLVPDLFMAGYLFGPRIGALIYNLGHTYSAPAALAVLALMTGLTVLLSAAIIWIAHIGLDRMLGYGLKLPGGFKQTDLGSL